MSAIGRLLYIHSIVIIAMIWLQFNRQDAKVGRSNGTVLPHIAFGSFLLFGAFGGCRVLLCAAASCKCVRIHTCAHLVDMRTMCTMWAIVSVSAQTTCHCCVNNFVLMAIQFFEQYFCERRDWQRDAHLLTKNGMQKQQNQHKRSHRYLPVSQPLHGVWMINTSADVCLERTKDNAIECKT